MKVLLYHLDGKLPNLALMRLAAFHRGRGDQVELRRGKPYRAIGDAGVHLVYGSLIFERSRPVAERLRQIFPGAILGGTGWDKMLTLEALGVGRQQDYSLYPGFRQSMGFTQRGCRLQCPFCVVPAKEGKVRAESMIAEIWRGEPWPKELLLLDNDFFGQAVWRERIREIREGGFKVSFNQGINARCLTQETAEAIASVDYRDDSMERKRIYTAWDNLDDEKRLFAGLGALCAAGVKPDHIMVYMLVGYWPGETAASRDYRRRRLREFGARPYPMPYVRTRELIGFQRWIVGAYDKRISWESWEANNYRPEGLTAEDITGAGSRSGAASQRLNPLAPPGYFR